MPVRKCAWVSISMVVAACAGEPAAPPRPAPPPPGAEPVAAPSPAESTEVTAAEAKAAEDERGILERVSAPARAAYEQGVTLVGSDAAAALAAFQRAAQASPEFYVAHYNAGSLLWAAGKVTEAAAAFAAALKAAPRYAPALAAQAVVLEWQGRAAEAQALLEQALAAQPEATELEVTLAELLARAGRLSEARERAIAVLRRDERNPRALTTMGMIYRRQKMYELSQQALSTALEIAPAAATYAELGLVYWGQDDKARAVAAFEHAVGVAPNDARLLNNLGAMRNEVGAFQGAITVLEQATALEPARAEYWLNLGNAYRGEQRYVDAEAAYRKATDAGSVAALFNLGVLYLDNELPEKDAVARYRESIAFLDAYRTKGTPDAEEAERIAEYVAVAEKAIEQEERRRDRERRRAEEEAQKQADEAAKAAAAAPEGDAAPKTDAPKTDAATPSDAAPKTDAATPSEVLEVPID